MSIHLEAVDHVGMQATHEEEMALFEKISACIHEMREGADYRQVLEESLSVLLVHAQAHFAEEEQMMEEIGFPSLEAHAQEHAEALVRLEAIVETWRKYENLEVLERGLMIDYYDWLKHHVLTMDMLTARFINIHQMQQEAS